MANSQRMNKADFITSLLLTFFGLGVFILSLRMPTFKEVGANPYSAPGIVPSALGFILFILGITLLIRSISRKGYQIQLSLNGFLFLYRKQSTRRFLIALFLSIIYVLLLGKVNYFILTYFYIFLFILFYEFNFKKKIILQKKVVIYAVLEATIIASCIAFVFQYLFLVRLP